MGRDETDIFAPPLSGAGNRKIGFLWVFQNSRKREMVESGSRTYRS
jgi:hypothetical protein